MTAAAVQAGSLGSAVVDELIILHQKDLDRVSYRAVVPCRMVLGAEALRLYSIRTGMMPAGSGVRPFVTVPLPLIVLEPFVIIRTSSMASYCENKSKAQVFLGLFLKNWFSHQLPEVTLILCLDIPQYQARSSQGIHASIPGDSTYDHSFVPTPRCIDYLVWSGT